MREGKSKLGTSRKTGSGDCMAPQCSPPGQSAQFTLAPSESYRSHQAPHSALNGHQREWHAPLSPCFINANPTQQCTLSSLSFAA